MQHPRLIAALHVFMIAFYLALILIPPVLPAPPEGASPLNNFVSFSRFVIWCVWWPLVVLSMLGFGRVWCGLFCPEGALAAFASRFGSNRPVPPWMKWGGVPLAAFVGITLLGELTGVDERPIPQLLVLGGSTLLAVSVALVYARRVWVWCRYLCPVSLLFGVFSRLGAMHFRVDRGRLAAAGSAVADPTKRGPCPVLIHLPAMATNRSCLMCFRCAGWRDAIHLGFRRPGEELLRINTAQPLFWEVMFLFGGAIGLPLGVFHADLLGRQGVGAAVLLLAGTLASLAALSAVNALAIRLLKPSGWRQAREWFTSVGYLYTPLALFSLVLGLSEPTFSHLETIGFPAAATTAIRIASLAVGAAWSVYLSYRILKLHAPAARTLWPAFLVHLVGLSSILAAWVPVLFP